ncbi:MAG: YggS family pyridoxal phosphate-dependent enzyme [Spirulinaceae cyanobacterium SM2_1_0]|nr:YggS family pyridoxal phosphate-dependent enzyme [Spirulinaceae cyanobacterium SM2_1_0]
MTSAIVTKIVSLRAELPPQVRLIAVTKTRSVAEVRAAYAAGLRDFAESRIQEALPKQAALVDLADICWHFIGHLQSNKAKKAIAQFHWLHTGDRLELLERLNRLAGESTHRPQVCLQVKVRPDPDKYGWSPAELMTALPALTTYTQIDLAGLMTILPLGLSAAETLAAFQDLHQLRATLRQELAQPDALPELSMGMSGDYPLAIQAGATMVRLGQAIFGPRSPRTGG